MTRDDPTFLAGYRAGFAAALAQLREPSEELVRAAHFADCRRMCSECEKECRFYDKDTDGLDMRAALAAAADAMGERRD